MRSALAARSLNILGLLVLTACAPVISQESLNRVDQGLTFIQVLERPHAHMGKSLLIGGEIVETVNRSRETQIMVLERPLGYRNRPKGEGESRGRFIITVPRFLDPAIYRTRRQVTLVGAVRGQETRPLGEIRYTYPVIQAHELYLWPVEGEPGPGPWWHFGVGVGVHF